MKLAAQLYTLRDFTQTNSDFAKAMRRVKDLGYLSVQVSAIGPIPALDVAKILKDEGLTCCATHAAIERITGDPPRFDR